MLTPQQLAAVAARDVSVSLAAGAGCGKTFVLTERFLSHLDPSTAGAVAELDQLVAITFTDAAAREMRDRIRRRCLERLRHAQGADAEFWQRLMRSIDAARISTIHAFCTALLRTHAVAAGLDPQFEVLDAPAAELLRLETVDDVLRERLLARDEDVLELAAAWKLDRLRDYVRLFCRPRGDGALERWSAATARELVDRWRQTFDEQIETVAAAELIGADEFRDLVRLADPQRARGAKLGGHLAELALVLADLEAGRRRAGDAAPRLVELARVQGVCRAADWHDAADYAAFKTAAEALRGRIRGGLLVKAFDEDGSLETARLGLALARLALDATRALEDQKTRRNQLEFDDLLVRTWRLLSDPAVSDAVAGAARGVQLVMVDEFQDTNPLQAAIVQAFCGPQWNQRGLFAVGDQKQSIYRFNGAEPRVSDELRAAVPPPGQLSLTRNFRSQPAIVDFVNAIFGGEFSGYEPLVASRPQVTATPAIEFLWTPGRQAVGAPPGATAASEGTAPPADGAAAPAAAKKRPRAGAAQDARVIEARWIARRLRALLDSGAPVAVDSQASPPRPRAVRPGDVAILLRSLSDAQAYEEALRGEDIEYYLAGGHAFYAQQEIYDILNLLKAVVSRVDEIALAGALRSPLFALSDESLYWLVAAHGSLNAALGEPPPNELPIDEAAKVRRAAATVARLRVEKDRLLVAELLALAVELTGFDAVLLAEFLGPRKAANVDKLLEQARAHDRTSPGDLPGYVAQLAELVVQAPKEALAATQAEGDVVRIMTIHHAKGLEFPVVILPDLARQRPQGGGEPVLDLELGPLAPKSDKNAESLVGFDLYRAREELLDQQERKRLLYVAVTRAADYLILSSAVDDLEAPKSDWLALLARSVSLTDGSLVRRLPEGWPAPQIRVTVAEGPPAAAGGRSRGPDLRRLVARTRAAIDAGAAFSQPATARPVAVGRAERRRFAFSRLSGELVAEPVDAGELSRTAATPPAQPERGRAVGKLVHAVLQRLDWKDPDAAEAWCDFLAPQYAPADPAAAAQAAFELVERFLATPRAAALAGARAVRRELEFLLPWPAGGVGRGRFLHGFIDVLYQDAAGAWRLLDYKTNRSAGRDAAAAARQYALQMLTYALACEQVLGEPPAECTLILLSAGVEHAYQWTAEERRAGRAQLTAAMDAVAGDR